MTPEQIAELRRLNAERTQGEWSAEVWRANTERPQLAIVGDVAAFDDDEVIAELPRVVTAGKRDFAFIAAIANAADALLSAAEENAFLHQRRGELVIERDNAIAQLMEWSKGEGPNQDLLLAQSSAAMKAALAENESAALRAENARLREALEMAAKTFRKYEQIHRDKGTDDARKKANSNMIIAQVCERALEPSHE